MAQASVPHSLQQASWWIGLSVDGKDAVYWDRDPPGVRCPRLSVRQAKVFVVQTICLRAARSA